MHINLQPGEHALVGYGSLLSVASMERTLGHPYAGPWHVVRVNGWRRGWDVQMPNTQWAYRDGDRSVTPERVVYLNVRPQTNAHINGALFVITADEMSLFDQRESVYDRVDVTSAIEGVHITGGAAWMYVAQTQFVWRQPSQPPGAIIRRSYVEILETAHAELGDAFRREYDATTDALPTHLVVDDLRT